MPRDLADVLHYFMPELAAEEPLGNRGAEPATRRTKPAMLPMPRGHRRPVPLPMAAIPVGERDIVRASLIASLAEEIAALGGDTTILVPATPRARGLFPAGLCEAPGARVEAVRAQSIGELNEAAADLAAALATTEHGGGVILVCVPPAWLRCVDEAADLLDWLLLFSSPNQRNLADTYALAARVLRENPSAEIGITIHGAAGRREAQDAFGLLARSVEQRLGRTLASYGLLVEDLDIYRSLVAGRAVGRAHPESPATLALREAAQLVFERARKAELH